MALKTYKKWDIVLVNLDPTQGSEIAKSRPCLIVSPNIVNSTMKTIIIAPFTSTTRKFPFRIATNHNGLNGELCFDHLRSIDKTRIIKSDGTLDINLRQKVNELLRVFFSDI